MDPTTPGVVVYSYNLEALLSALGFGLLIATRLALQRLSKSAASRVKTNKVLYQLIMKQIRLLVLNQLPTITNHSSTCVRVARDHVITNTRNIR